MKKSIILIIILVLGLAVTLASPVIAAAPTLGGIAPNNGTPGPTATVDITGVILTGTNFITGATILVDGSGVSATVNSIDSPTQITATFHLTAGAPAGTRNVTVHTTDGTSGAQTFTINSYFNLSAPAAINLGVMTVGGSATGNSTGSVSTNISTWSVTAKDVKATDPGFMTKTSPYVKLATPLQIKNSTSGIFANANDGITYSSNPTNLPFYVSQQVATGDAPGAYSITITFTGVP